MPHASQRCAAGPVFEVTPDQAEAAPFPFTRDALDEACGPAGALFDEHRDLLGHSRSGDNLLIVLARVGDDLDYVRRTLAPSQPGRERRSAQTHLRGALDSLDEPLTSLKSGEIGPYHYHQLSTPESWRRAVSNDRHGVGQLHGHLGRYAFGQGLDPSLVRGRMLHAFSRAAQADLHSRHQDLDRASLVPEEATARQAYLHVADQTLATLVQVVDAYVAGQVRDAELRTHLISRADQAHAAWKAAHAAELDRIPPSK